MARPAGKVYTEITMVLLTADQDALFRTLCDKHGVARSVLIRKLITRWCEHMSNQKEMQINA